MVPADMDEPLNLLALGAVGIILLLNCTLICL